MLRILAPASILVLPILWLAIDGSEVNAESDIRPAPYPWQTPADTAIQDRLDSIIEPMRVDAVPLDDLLAQIGRRIAAPVIVDWKALEDSAIDQRSEISVELAPIRIDVLLRWALDQADGGEVELDYAVIDGSLHIATRAALYSRKITVNYPCADLIRWDALTRRRLRIARSTDSIDQLAYVIMEVVDPESWKEAGGRVGTIHQLGDRLVIEQAIGAQQQIADLLAELRRARIDSPVDGD
jgi:hypothetical protein